MSIADVVAPWSEDPKLTICVITFKLVQPLCPRYLNVIDGQTDGQTDGRLTIAMSRFALRASRGKNRVKRLGACQAPKARTSSAQVSVR